MCSITILNPRITSFVFSSDLKLRQQMTLCLRNRQRVCPVDLHLFRRVIRYVLDHHLKSADYELCFQFRSKAPTTNDALPAEPAARLSRRSSFVPARYSLCARSPS